MKVCQDQAIRLDDEAGPETSLPELLSRRRSTKPIVLPKEVGRVPPVVNLRCRNIHNPGPESFGQGGKIRESSRCRCRLGLLSCRLLRGESTITRVLAYAQTDKQKNQTRCSQCNYPKLVGFSSRRLHGFSPCKSMPQ